MFGKEPAVILGAIQATLALGLSFGLQPYSGTDWSNHGCGSSDPRTGSETASHTS